MFARRWPRAPHGLIDAIVAAAPVVLDRYKINTPRRLAHFMAQVSHECGGGTITEENLRYSAVRMTQVWPSRFRTISAAQPYAYNPKALATKVYNGRMGNRVGTDDGWIYRGRGLIQITGRDGYVQVGKVSGLDLVSNPAMANEPKSALEVAAAFWTWKKLNSVADTDSLTAVTRIVNGGTTGLADRQVWLNRWKAELGA
jgi:putative chitinase